MKVNYVLLEYYTYDNVWKTIAQISVRKLKTPTQLTAANWFSDDHCSTLYQNRKKIGFWLLELLISKYIFV